MPRRQQRALVAARQCGWGVDPRAIGDASAPQSHSADTTHATIPSSRHVHIESSSQRTSCVHPHAPASAIIQRKRLGKLFCWRAVALVSCPCRCAELPPMSGGQFAAWATSLAADAPLHPSSPRYSLDADQVPARGEGCATPNFGCCRVSANGGDGDAASGSRSSFQPPRIGWG